MSIRSWTIPHKIDDLINEVQSIDISFHLYY